MKRIKSGLIITLLSVYFLPACATHNYVEPKIAAAATVFNYYKAVGDVLSPRWVSFDFEAIDGQVIPHDAELSLEERGKFRYAVMPGSREFLIHAEFNRTYGSTGPFQADIKLNADLDTNKQYQLNGAIKDGTIEVWLTERRSGQLVSTVESAPYVERPKDLYPSPKTATAAIGSAN